jgi:hypothetical protein
MQRSRIILFTLFVTASVALTALYVWQAIAQPLAPQPAATAAAQTTAVALKADHQPATGLEQPPRFFAVELDNVASRGQIKVAALTTPSAANVAASLRCDRMHFAAGVGICLQNLINLWGTPAVSVTLFSESFQPLQSQRVDGYPSRTRVSPDGNYAAYTVFVSGHSYNDANFSTATHILEVATGNDLGNLEEFTVWRDGQIIDAIDFNFWGVTFANDSNRFYATLSTGGVPSLVEGNIAERRMTVLYDGVECPSLSPDNGRIAFKKARDEWEWQLTVLDLATLTETPLAESRSVDDQVEWLDNATILYQQIEYDASQNGWINVLSVPADGSGAPALFAARVGSPAVVY